MHPNAYIDEGTAQDIRVSDGAADLVVSSGVLIHVHPDDLGTVVDEMVRVADRYIVIAEYFSKEEREVHYRGHGGMLWTRDFGKFAMERHPKLTCIDYGFHWQLLSGMDDVTWWLFAKGDGR